MLTCELINATLEVETLQGIYFQNFQLAGFWLKWIVSSYLEGVSFSNKVANMPVYNNISFKKIQKKFLIRIIWSLQADLKGKIIGRFMGEQRKVYLCCESA
jgi:hypothetical protein